MNNLEKLSELTHKLDELHEFNNRLIHAINASHEGIAVLDKNGIFVYSNKAHETMFGYRHGELIGKSWMTLYNEKNIDWFKNNVFPVLEEKGCWNGNAVTVSKNGVDKVEIISYLTSLSDGGLICTCRPKK